MKDKEWKANSKRRKKSAVDIVAWARFIKKTSKALWSLPGGPFVLIIGIFLFVISLLVFIEVSTGAGKIHSGVRIANYDVGNMSKNEAAKALKKRFESNLDNAVYANFNKRKLAITPRKLELKLDYEKSVNNAFKFGRSQNPARRTLNHLLSWFRSIEVEPVYSINKDKMNAFLEELGKDEHKAAVNASVSISNGKVFLVKPREGFGINRKKAEKKIIAAVLNPQEVTLNAERLYPNVGEREAQEAYRNAKIIISKDVLLKFAKKSWKINKQKLISLFKLEDREDSIKATLNRQRTQMYLKKVTANLNQEPRSAKFDIKGVNVDIIPSLDGIDVNIDKTYENVVNTALSQNLRIAGVAYKRIAPKRTTAKAKGMGIKKMISTFTTYYKPGRPRVKNIHLLAEILDGTLIAPGEEFSFNKTVGQRTEERGFVKAPQIVGAKLVDSVGGGICQVATTFFNTILKGGYPIGQRSPHSLFIDHYPEGRDAAVSWPKPDLTFTNDTKSWILIKGSYTATSISISFYSTDYGRVVSFKTKLVAKIAFEVEEIKDNTLEEGKRVEEEKGAQGRRYLSIRTVKKDGKVIRETKIRSTFKPKKRVVRVGTKKKKEDKKKSKKDKNSTSNDNEQGTVEQVTPDRQ